MSSTFTCIAQLPDQSINCRSGATYQSDGSCVIRSVAAQDILDILQAGCKIGGNLTERLAILAASAITGAPLGAAAAAGVMGYSITLGTSAFLVGEATSSNAKTDTCLFEYILPASYVAGTALNLVVNANYSGSGTVTAASCSVTPTVYPEADAGTLSANICSASQLITATAQDLTFSLTGTNLTPGQKVMIELSLLVTTASGANTGAVNSVRLVIP